MEREFYYCIQLGPTQYKTQNKPFHGGDTGSTPVRDAKFLSIFAICMDVSQLTRFVMDSRGRA